VTANLAATKAPLPPVETVAPGASAPSPPAPPSACTEKLQIPDGTIALDVPGVVASSRVTIEEGEIVGDADASDPPTSIEIAPTPARTVNLRISSPGSLRKE
jgi:hypothetical protein